MAFSRNAASMGWLLIGPLALQPALLAAALDAPAKGLNRSAATLLAQAPAPADAAIPMEVQGWAESAVAAYTRGEPAAALRLQRQVLAWTQANRPTLDVFRARAFINLGTFLNAVRQQQEALAPTEEAVRILRQLEGSQPEARRFLAIALNNLGIPLHRPWPPSRGAGLHVRSGKDQSRAGEDQPGPPGRSGHHHQQLGQPAAATGQPQRRPAAAARNGEHKSDLSARPAAAAAGRPAA